MQLLTPYHNVESIRAWTGMQVSLPPLWTYVVAPYGRLLCAMLVSWQRVCVPQARRQSPLSWDPLRLGRRQMALPVTVTLGRGRWDQQPWVKWSGQTCVITQDEQHWLAPGPDTDLCMKLGNFYYMFKLGCCSITGLLCGKPKNKTVVLDINNQYFSLYHTKVLSYIVWKLDLANH